MAAGSIIVDLLMRTGAFETDTARAEKRLKAFQKQAEQVGKTIGVAIAAGVTLAVAAFDQLVKAAADFKDIEETTGALAEDFASLAVPLATAGISMESMAAASLKLTKSLSGVDDESKAAGAALTALGIPIEEFKALDPVAQIDALTKAFGEFKDGPKKAEVAMALFGKTGAEQLKLFKALEEQGGRQVILTQKQIELADAYADAQATQIAKIKAYAQAAAVDVLPAMNDLVGAAAELVREFTGVDTAGKKLAGESPVKEFAETAVNALAFLVDAADGVVRVFQIIGSTIGAVAAQQVALLSGNFAEAATIGKLLSEDIDRILDKKWFSDRVEGIRAARKEAERFASIQNDPRELARRGRGPAARPELQFDGAATKEPKQKKQSASEVDRYIESLQKQLEKTEELTAVEQVLADIENRRISGINAASAGAAIALAQELDARKAFAEETKRLVAEADAREAESNRLRSEAASIYEATRTPAEQYAATIERLNKLLQAGALDQDTYSRAVTKAQEDFEATAKKADDFKKKLAENTQDLLGEGLYEVLDGNFKNIGDRFVDMIKRMVAEAAAADIARRLFGADAKGNVSGSGGLLGALFKGIGSYFGGSTGTPATVGAGSSGAYLGEMATGTDYVPRDGFAKLHKGEKVVPKKYNPSAGGGGLEIKVENPPGMPLNAKAREENGLDGRRTIKLVLEAVAADFKQGGQVSQAYESTYGGRRQMPRRGT